VAVGPACWAAGAGERRERIGLRPREGREGFSLFFPKFVSIFVSKLFLVFEIYLKFQTSLKFGNYPWPSKYTYGHVFCLKTFGNILENLNLREIQPTLGFSKSFAYAIFLGKIIMMLMMHNQTLIRF
jgi:hypothetical protein